MNVKYSMGLWFRQVALKKSKRQAIAWVIRLNDPDLSQKLYAEFFMWLEASAENQLEYLKAERAWDAAGDVKSFERVAKNHFSFNGWMWAGALTCCLLISFIFI